MPLIPINIAVEDPLSEAVVRKILTFSKRDYDIGRCYNRGGFGYLKKAIYGFNHAAKITPFLILTDLDQTECAPILLQKWLPLHRHPNLLFRIAVREVETWLLADRTNFAKFLGIPATLIPINVDDELSDPKQFLLQIATRSRNRMLRHALVSASGETLRRGPDYNGCLIGFVAKHWNIMEATANSPSLQRTVRTVKNFQPSFASPQT